MTEKFAAKYIMVNEMLKMMQIRITFLSFWLTLIASVKCLFSQMMSLGSDACLISITWSPSHVRKCLYRLSYAIDSL